jgi:hypothetical protein
VTAGLPSSLTGGAQPLPGKPPKHPQARLLPPPRTRQGTRLVSSDEPAPHTTGTLTAAALTAASPRRPAAAEGALLAWFPGRIPYGCRGAGERGTGRARASPWPCTAARTVALSPPGAACDVLILRFVPRAVATVTPPGLIAQGGAWGHCAGAPVRCRVTVPPRVRGGPARWGGIGGMRRWQRWAPLPWPAE